MRAGDAQKQKQTVQQQQRNRGTLWQTDFKTQTRHTMFTGTRETSPYSLRFIFLSQKNNVASVKLDIVKVLSLLLDREHCVACLALKCGQVYVKNKNKESSLAGGQSLD